jgi:hypothetical protein
MKAAMINDPITTTEAAAILNIDPSAIRHRILADKIEWEKRGRDLYVSRKTIQSEADKKKSRNGGGSKKKK